MFIPPTPHRPLLKTFSSNSRSISFHNFGLSCSREMTTTKNGRPPSILYGFSIQRFYFVVVLPENFNESGEVGKKIVSLAK